MANPTISTELTVVAGPQNVRPYVDPSAAAVNNLSGQAAGSVNDAMAARNNFLSTSPALKFPLVDFPNYCIQFRFAEYKKPSSRSSGSITPKVTIRLPIPRNLVDTFSESYGTENLGPIIGAAIEGVTNISQGNFTQAAANFGGGAAAIGIGIASGIAGEVINKLPNRGALSNVIGDIGRQIPNAASALSGKLFNPFQTVLYKNPEFKRFTFDWLLTPKNTDETKVLKEIITRIQYHMSPSYSSFGSAVMNYPDIVQTELLTSENPADYLFKFKKCVVTNFSVNYVPAGTPSFFKDTKAPTAVRISMQLQEIEIWTKESLESSAAEYALNN